MKSDFHDAHLRHFSDANYLYAAQRWANADHLYGVAAECGLKCLMQVFGMKVDPNTGSPVESDDRVHVTERRKKDVWMRYVDEYWERYDTYRSGRDHAADYGLPTVNPFLDWDVGQRYAHQSRFDPSWVDPHQAATCNVHRLVIKAQLEGLL